MQVVERFPDWMEDESARLSAEIRRSMARLGGAGSQRDNVRIGDLIERRIDTAFERALRAALSGHNTPKVKTARIVR